jgi:hypothetical protein
MGTCATHPTMIETARHPLVFVAILASCISVVLGGLLFEPGATAPSHPWGDTARYLSAARQFTVDQLLQGSIPLWNPHTFSGAPFVGVFQSSMFYPLNWHYLVLPLSVAVTLEFSLHLFLLGIFTFSWLRGNDLRPLGAGFAALVVVFGATSFLRVTAGQLTVLDTMAWTPLLLLCVDQLTQRSTMGWCLAAIGGTSMMVLAGHPPTVYMAGVAIGLYCIPRLLNSPVRTRAAAALAFVPIAAFFLSAVQLWTGLDLATEGVRQSGTSFEFATSYSFPPENLLTLLVPDAFGSVGLNHVNNWGRWYYWDTSAYLGVIALFFAVHGAIFGTGRMHSTCLLLCGVLFVLALGRYTPAYAILYHGVPGFELFRAPSKFLFFAALYAAPLVALGVERALDTRAGTRATSIVAFSVALLMVAGAVWAQVAPSESTVQNSPMAWLSTAKSGVISEPGLLESWRAALISGFGLSAALAFAAGALFWVRAAGQPHAILLLLAIGSLELLLFAHSHRGQIEIPPALVTHSQLPKLYEQAGHDRVLEMGPGTNAALHLGGLGVWGYDPVKLDRYSRFIASTQGVHASDLNEISFQSPTRFHPLFLMLRTRFQAWRQGQVVEHPGAMARHLLINDYRIAESEADALAAVMADSFDPRTTVILEREPVPSPSTATTDGEIRLIDESTDHMSFEIDLADAAILLITDSYARGWRARALPGSVQREYELQEANYVLRAVPLAAGRHRLIVEYVPMAFRAGAWSSALCTLVFLAACAHRLHRRRWR